MEREKDNDPHNRKDPAVSWVMWLLAILAILIGGGAYAIGFSVCATGSVSQTIWLTAGNVLIVGGIVGFVTNVLQSFNFFRKELRKELFSDEYMRRRGDIDHVWEVASAEIFNQKFPEIQEEFLAALKKYLPCDDVAYYDDYESHIELQWIDPQNKIINVAETKLFKLVPGLNDSLQYTYKTWTPVNDEDFYKNGYKYELKAFLVNDVDCLPRVTNHKSYENGVAVEENSLRLSGEKKYDIRIEDSKTYRLSDDMVIGFFAKHITHGFRVELMHPENLKVQFVAAGTQGPFKKVKNKSNVCEMRFEGVIFPKQGYIFAVSNK